LSYTKPLVGFDRFVRYEWAERALEIAIQNQDPQSLLQLLIEFGIGKESARRTWNVLTMLWLRPFEDTGILRDKAFELLPKLTSEERIVLHWGMAMAQFPLFHHTVRTIGVLGRLQNEFKQREIIDRVLENYSNQTTIRRAVSRIVYTLGTWKVLEGTQSRGEYYISKPLVLTSFSLVEWLFLTIMYTTKKHWPTLDLFRAPEIFPFYCPDAARILHQSPLFLIQRDSFDAEIVELNDYPV